MSISVEQYRITIGTFYYTGKTRKAYCHHNQSSVTTCGAIAIVLYVIIVQDDITHIHMTQYLPIAPERLIAIRRHTSQDDTLQQLAIWA